MTSVPPPLSNVLQVPDYTTYLVWERRQLLTRYLCVERDLAGKKLEYGQTLSDEKQTKAVEWQRAIEHGMSATAADKAADYRSAYVVAESIQLRVQVDVLEREAAMIRLLLEE